MGSDSSVHNASHTKCDLASFDVCLPAEDDKPIRQRATWERV